MHLRSCVDHPPCHRYNVKESSRVGVSSRPFVQTGMTGMKLQPTEMIKNDEKLNSDTEKFPIVSFVFLMFLVPPSVVQGSNFDNT